MIKVEKQVKFTIDGEEAVTLNNVCELARRYIDGTASKMVAIAEQFVLPAVNSGDGVAQLPEDFSVAETVAALTKAQAERDRLAAENANWKRDNAVLVKLAEGKDAEIRRLRAPAPDVKVDVDALLKPFAVILDSLKREDLGRGSHLVKPLSAAIEAVRARLTQAPPESEDYIAWARWKHRGQGDNEKPYLVWCDSDAEGAFKVYRHPAQPDPWARLEAWLRESDEHYVEYADELTVYLSFGGKTEFSGTGPTLPEAVTAALDKAGVK